MTALPALRRKILKSFSVVVALYGLLGLLLVASVVISSKTTPRLLHVNYDSIAAANQMHEAWDAIASPSLHSQRSQKDWVTQFEQALKLEENNISEPGELELATSVRKTWDEQKKSITALDPTSFQAMETLLNRIVAVNEKGMFGAAEDNDVLSRRVLVGSLIYFLITLIFVVIVAQQLSQRLAAPLKNIAEVLHSRPSVSKKLKLPEPTTLELFILTTEIKRLWERLAESEKVNVAELIREKSKLESVLDSVEDAMLFLDASGTISHCNDRLSKLVGLPCEKIQGLAWNDLPSMSENYLKLRGILREDMPDSQEIELVQEDQTKFHYSARSKAMNSAPGAPDAGGMLYLLHDITEKRQRDKFRSEFVDLLSHELKTPLQSLGTATELLTERKAQFADDLKLIVETITEDVERIKAVAQEFMQVTQSHSKILKLKLEKVALNQVLAEWIKPFSILARDRKVKLEFSQEGSAQVWANIDIVKFPWVISNLLSNAIRHSPAASVVSVLLTDRNGAVEIQVRDEGAGIPEADRERIFEAFFQGTMASGGRGLFGVGLTIAKEVVEAHDGRIEYFTRHPKGSEFRITLPFPPL